MNRKKRRLKQLFLVGSIGLGLILKTSVSLAAPEINVHIEQKTAVRVGEDIRLILQISWKSAEADYRFQVPVLSSEDFVFEELAEGNEVFQKNGEEWHKKIFRFTLKASKAGKGVIQPFQINYLDTATQSNGFLNIQAIEHKIIDDRSALYWIIGTIGLLGSIGLTILKWMARIRNHEKTESATVIPTIEEKYISLLLECKERINSQDAAKSKLYESGKMFRDYLSQKFDIPGGGMGTTDIILRNIQSKIPNEELRILRKIFDRLDELRYANTDRLMDESRALFHDMIRFIEGKKVIPV